MWGQNNVRCRQSKSGHPSSSSVVTRPPTPDTRHPMLLARSPKFLFQFILRHVDYRGPAVGARERVLRLVQGLDQGAHLLHLHPLARPHGQVACQKLQEAVLPASDIAPGLPATSSISPTTSRKDSGLRACPPTTGTALTTKLLPPKSSTS